MIIKPTHEIKVLPEYFNELVDGNKKFEIRENDRDYKVGDIVYLREWDDDKFTGNALIVKITYILTAEQFSEGLQRGYCVWSFDGLGLYYGKEQQ